MSSQDCQAPSDTADSLIFVHGLGSNPDTTWSAKPTASSGDAFPPSRMNGDSVPRENWVTELFLPSIPDELSKSTSVYFFNYNSYWVRDALVFRTKHISDDLLGHLAVSLKKSVSGLDVKETVSCNDTMLTR